MTVTDTLLNIGLLLCDDVDAEYRDEYTDYLTMFQSGMNEVDSNIKLHPIRCFEGERPGPPSDYDAYLISGSRSGVYEDQQWIRDLMSFVRQCWDARIKCVGICFGHQLIAHALGGHTEKSDAGWGIGVHTARITSPQSWMSTVDRTNQDYNLVVIHQDQVVSLPSEFTTIAENSFCPNSMIVADGRMLGIQGHPEFSREFAEMRVRLRESIIDPEQFESGMRSYTLQPDSRRVLSWISRFLREPA